jgi:hypothetical protein
LYRRSRREKTKSAILAGTMTLAIGTVSLADRLYWVVGNRETNKCDIVTSNPIIIGDIWFGDGLYKSMSDAKLVRSTIGACPKEEDQPADCKDSCGKRY